tara:strand:- start:380 stop:1759 length:1380 start_codon:yes stop_codon:yes gene_type:complete
MATYRIGIGSEFQLKDQAAGIGNSTTGLGNLIVEGRVKASGLSDVGVTTSARYSGLIQDEIDGGGINLSGEFSSNSDIVVGSGSTFTVSSGSTVDVGTVENMTIGNHFSVPIGNIEDRPEAPVEGTVRFNTELNTLEFYNGLEWRQFTINGSSNRAVVGAGYISPQNTFYKDLEYFSISSGGNALSFGEMSSGSGGRSGASFGSSTRGVFATGYNGNGFNIIDYITIPSSGTAEDFGDASGAGYNGDGCSSSTRGVYNLGYIHPGPSYNSTLDYVEIATLGSRADYGDLTAGGGWNAAASSPTRGFFGGFYPRNDGSLDVIKIASTGTAIKFGNLYAHYGSAACSNSVRAIFAGGTLYPSPGYAFAIQSVIMASDGTIEDFGESYNGDIMYAGRGVASQTRGCITGGSNAAMPASIDEVTTIQYVDLNSGGTATAFGDMSIPRRNHRGVSDSHGGLGGY